MMSLTTTFDLMAGTYDADFTASVIGRMQRKRVWSLLTPLLEAKSGKLRILEINCGTGEDALQLSRMGHEVVATDAAAAMIDQVKHKLKGFAQADAVESLVCDFAHLKEKLDGQKFDLVFSNFGGLNCIDKTALTQLQQDLATLVKPGGNLFLVLMGRCCLREIFHYGIRGRLGTAFRRFRQSVNFQIKGSSMPVYYYWPSSIKKIFSKNFNWQSNHPVGLFIPPSYLENKFRAKQERLLKLEAMEQRYDREAYSALADHFCIVFTKPEKE